MVFETVTDFHLLLTPLPYKDKQVSSWLVLMKSTAMLWAAQRAHVVNNWGWPLTHSKGRIQVLCPSLQETEFYQKPWRKSINSVCTRTAGLTHSLWLIRDLDLKPGDPINFAHIPNPYKLEYNNCCFKPLSFGVICYIVLDNFHTLHKVFLVDINLLRPWMISFILKVNHKLSCIVYWVLIGHFSMVFCRYLMRVCVNVCVFCIGSDCVLRGMFKWGS